MNTREEIYTMLSYIPSDDREIWVRMCFATKHALGDDGFDIWLNWSKTSEKFNLNSAMSTWRSARQDGGVTAASMYVLAKEYGYQYRGDPDDFKRIEPVKVDDAKIKRQLKEQENQRIAAAQKAADMLSRASIGNHPYLAKKGFPEFQMPIDDVSGLLLCPMRNDFTGDLQSLQTIADDGTKRFLKGGKASEAVYRLGKSTATERWYVEGIATGLSVWTAIDAMGRRHLSQIVICYSAGNLRKVASKRKYGIIVADHDASGAGVNYAHATGLRYWYPPDVNTDANDFHQQYGIESLVKELRKTLIN